jgi:hypothetical protein
MSTYASRNLPSLVSLEISRIYHVTTAPISGGQAARC